MVTLTPKLDHDEAIRRLVGAELHRVDEWRQAGTLEELYVSRPGRAWLVLVAESAAEAERLIADLPLHPHVDATVERLIA
jgi:hypothetical protein